MIRLLGILCFLLPLQGYAQPYSHGVALAWGEGSSRWTLLGDREMTPDAYRLSYISPQLISWRVATSHRIDLDAEFSAHHWNDPWRDKHVSGVSIVPMFRWHLELSEISLYAGLGIGIMFIDDDQWMDRLLGSHSQFEDKFELGLQAGRHRLAATLSHYSNANLADINHGVNVYYVSYTLMW
ncbi:acyloxyacyl hydrolase [Aestuariibacter salexigens]|uniref:acyloxyacyl hydrolase n=1 Tax=Aestuariibacter salexigens TaxID=226010 RepID=UPI0004080731|nr:acyloxyacyl hydrolase [Aestuariibacter salexigens]